MPDPDFPGIRAALLNGGIAPKYVRRALDELQAHFADLCAEAAEHGFAGDAAATYAAEKIGTCDALVAAYLEQKRLMSWGARWPKTLFIIAPLLSIILMMMALTAGAAALLALYTLNPGHGRAVISPAARYLSAVFPAVIEYGLPAMICLAISIYAIRRRLAPLWPAVGILTIALLASMTDSAVTLPGNGNPGTTGFGFGPFPFGLEGVLMHLLLAAPFAAGPYYARWRRRLGRRH